MVEFYVNTGELDEEREETGTEFTLVNLTYDRLIFSMGSDTVADGCAIPTPQQLNSAGALITTIDVEIPHYFLADADVVLLKEIHNAGNQDTRFVFCAAFDGETASEPILELWDNEDLDSIENYSLGEGIPSHSFHEGITTTEPNDWAEAKTLAGSSDNHFLWLNNENGALEGAKDLYWNLRITIPANFTNSAAETPVWVIKWTEN